MWKWIAITITLCLGGGQVYLKYCFTPARIGAEYLSAIRTRESEYSGSNGRLLPIDEMLSLHSNIEGSSTKYDSYLTYVLSKYRYSVNGDAKSFEVVASPGQVAPEP